MTGFENKTFRELVSMKAFELEKMGTEEAETLSEDLRILVRRIYAFQSKETADKPNERMA